MIVVCTYIIKYYILLNQSPKMHMGETKSPNKFVLENNKKDYTFGEEDKIRIVAQECGPKSPKKIIG